MKVHTHTPAGELLYGDPFLDKLLSMRVDEWQNWVLRALVLDCHLVEEQTRCVRAAEAQDINTSYCPRQICLHVKCLT